MTAACDLICAHTLVLALCAAEPLIAERLPILVSHTSESAVSQTVYCVVGDDPALGLNLLGWLVRAEANLRRQRGAAAGGWRAPDPEDDDTGGEPRYSGSMAEPAPGGSRGWRTFDRFHAIADQEGEEGEEGDKEVDSTDFYRVLGLPCDLDILYPTVAGEASTASSAAAAPQLVREAYKRRSMDTHPDRPNGSSERFQRVAEVGALPRGHRAIAALTCGLPISNPRRVAAVGVLHIHHISPI